jgi:hypothetical protein
LQGAVREVETLHEPQEVVAHRGVDVPPDLPHVSAGEDAKLVDVLLVVEDVVDVVGDPVGLEDDDVVQLLVVLEVEDVAQVVEPLRERGSALVAHVVLVHQIEDALG